MLFNSIVIIFGFILLAWAAERLVFAAASIANMLNISPLIIGLTIVGLGTSAPEIFVSITAAASGNAAIAIGNAVGSNIANLGLVLGLSALLLPIQIRSQILRREYPILFLIMLLTWFLMIDGVLDLRDGLILLFVLMGLLIWLVWLSKRQATTPPQLFDSQRSTLGKAIAWLIVGLILLPAAAYVIVWAAINIATLLGISELIIGLTIIAIGTSLPEVAASIAGLIKGKYDIAVGNILGSNMFNLLIVLAIPGLLQPVQLTPEIMRRDIPVMFILTIIFFVVSYGFKGPGRINRWEGLLLLSVYFAYLGLLVTSTLR